MDLTVIIPTHNPDSGRWRATLDALRRQTLAPDRWTAVAVDNASAAFPAPDDYADVRPPHFSVVRESRLGLTFARRRGLAEARTPFIAFVDDDNVLASDYLANTLAFFAVHPGVGLVGGKSLPQFEVEPPAWAREFFPLLALRDLGDAEMVSAGPRPAGTAHDRYPACAPIGAGMAARTDALRPWLERPDTLTDRRGADLSSAGDNDIVLCALRAGWEVGYAPQLRLTHLIPAARLDPAHLARLNRGVQKSWMQVLFLHEANSWPPIPAWTLSLRRLKMWFAHRAWRGPAQHIRWQGACGHFEGRVG